MQTPSPLATAIGSLTGPAARALGSFLVASCFCVTPSMADFDPVSGKQGGDAAARNFSEYCAGELSPKRRARFESEFQRAEADLAEGRVEEAEAAMGRAMNAAYRGGADSDTSIKCLGEPIARRWFKARLELDRQYAKRDSRNRRARDAHVRVTANDLGAAALVDFFGTLEPKSFVSSLRSLESILERMDAERRYGAFMLAEEESLERTIRKSLDALRQYAAKQHREELAAETQAFLTMPSEEERAASEVAKNAEGLLQAFIGEDLGSVVDEEIIVLNHRIQSSREHLRRARIWNLTTVEDRSGMPSSRRARQRGDEMLACGRDDDGTLLMRDVCFEAASDYYDFAGLPGEVASVDSERAPIEKALRAEREKREATIERTAAKMKREAESMKKSLEKMKKSETEKRTFDDEAKAMEDELGF